MKGECERSVLDLLAFAESSPCLVDLRLSSPSGPSPSKRASLMPGQERKADGGLQAQADMAGMKT